jgi:16S rRNA (guanine966-N2)-methyltransferase
MRIVGGKFKGKRIEPPRLSDVRPTTDFAKEALFNILNNRINWEETSMLDLFSGTGSISFEAVSRGVKELTCVEQHPKKCAFIESTLKTLEIEKPKVYKTDVFKFLKTTKEKFDFVFADPPYELKDLEKLPALIFPELLNKGALFVLEHGKKNDFSLIEGFECTRSYGNVYFSFFTNK